MPTFKREVHENRKSFERAGKKLTFEQGKLAMQADSGITVKFEDWAVLFTTVMNKNPVPTTDFLPLMVDMRESFSAAGRIG
ncbi:hypothetical protein IKO50_05070 [bacterium]|jgi:polyribonucleotide nucleotidyltransferase|nr:hypothetical protein [bacterium]